MYNDNEVDNKAMEITLVAIQTRKPVPHSVLDRV